MQVFRVYSSQSREVECEGIVFTDGCVVSRQLTGQAHTRVWASLKDCLAGYSMTAVEWMQPQVQLQQSFFGADVDGR